MKKFSLVSALFILFFAVSCDSGVKFNNPNDINSDAYQGGGDAETQDIDSEQSDNTDVSDSEPTDTDDDSDTDTSNSDITDNDTTNADNDDTDNTDTADSTPDNDSNTDQGRKQGELYGECYPNDTCNAGLTCDVENNICIRDNGDTTPDDDADTSDANDDSGNSGPDDDTDTGTAELTKEEKCNVLGGNWNASQSKCTRTQNCPDKPANTVWNDGDIIEGTFTQTWNVEEWIPASYDSSYSLTAGICRYKCADGYTWNNGACEQVQTRTAECKKPLPENTEWNTVDRITQTYTSSGWEPSTTPVYNPEPSENECRYKCVSGYFMNDGVCKKNCDINKCFKTHECTGEALTGIEMTGTVSGHGTCSNTTGECLCDAGWITGTSDLGAGTTVQCGALVSVFETLNNVECTICDKNNPPSEYATSGCPQELTEDTSLCNSIYSLTFCGMGGSCYYEPTGDHKLYCVCSSGYHLEYGDKYTGYCASDTEG